MATNSEIRFQVDARTLRSFKKKVEIAGRGVAGATKDALIDFCEEVLLDATQLVPIDTGALARSADYQIKGSAKKGYTAKMGYGTLKRNPVNRRTGQRASAYAGIVHEQIRQHENGQAKFFEQALYLHEDELETFTGKRISKYLSKVVVSEFDGEEDEGKGEAERQGIIAARSQESFTEQVDGKLLPFPVPHGLVYHKGGRWWLNREKYKKTDKKGRSGKRGKSTGETARSVRSSEIHRYTRERVVPKKKTKRKTKRRTSQKTKATKVSAKQSKTSKSVKGARTAANKKSVKRAKFIGELAHETALDEYMEHMFDEAAEKRREREKEKEEKRRW